LGWLQGTLASRFAGQACRLLKRTIWLPTASLAWFSSRTWTLIRP